MYQVEIYEDKNGKSEIKDYIKNLQTKKNKDAKIKVNKIIAYVRMLEKKGLTLGNNYIKHIEGDIWELRPIRDRILFAYIDNNKFILLNQFVKKSQKTPKSEITKAKRLLEDYRNRSD